MSRGWFRSVTRGALPHPSVSSGSREEGLGKEQPFPLNTALHRSVPARTQGKGSGTRTPTKGAYLSRPGGCLLLRTPRVRFGYGRDGGRAEPRVPDVRLPLTHHLVLEAPPQRVGRYRGDGSWPVVPLT